VGLDSYLAQYCGRNSGCDFLAREVSKGPAVVLDSQVGVAFLGRVCGAALASVIVCKRDFWTLDGEAPMKRAFTKISRVGSLTGGTKWYLSEDCLLAAKRMMYAVEYRRFYLRDLEYVMVWPSRLWMWRLITPAVLIAVLGSSLWHWVNSTAGAIFVGVALAWVTLELALGPTAASRIRTTGATVDLPLVRRTRRARNVLAKIDAAVRATRGTMEQPSAAATISKPAEPGVPSPSEAPANAAVAAASQTNVS
jgi:hypothetical protein